MFTWGFDMIVPTIMIVLGALYLKRPPAKINWKHGYRSRRSMQSQETWNFAHQYCGKLWLGCGIGTFMLTLVVMLCVLGKNGGEVSLAGGIICMLQCFVLIGAIFPTENALKHKFGV